MRCNFQAASSHQSRCRTSRVWTARACARAGSALIIMADDERQSLLSAALLRSKRRRWQIKHACSSSSSSRVPWEGLVLVVARGLVLLGVLAGQGDWATSEWATLALPAWEAWDRSLALVVPLVSRVKCLRNRSRRCTL